VETGWKTRIAPQEFYGVVCERPRFRNLWRTALSADIIDINERAREAWEAFLFAKERAHHTGDFHDGLKARRAWRTFLNFSSGDTLDRPLAIVGKEQAKP